ncbi:AbrB/MazE/SpoVT family DNA-binding domain-containing protein [Cupriavidus sp. TMH.W2]|uniref:AbrB/MazE/SpoVT family DNA-binding domain-containing protein n=1 Tax=Cupriavidus sp. TMH.W2 TaxID=3434465 RepID=UPI003D784EFA
MILRIAKWGGSLALRIPANFARQIGLKEGDQVQANLTVDGNISIRASQLGPQRVRARIGINARSDAHDRVCHGGTAARHSLLT